MEPVDFSGRRNFPGTKGGPFEIIVRVGMGIERVPALLFGLILIGWALLVTQGDQPTFWIYLTFTYLDWLLLRLLPILGLSYGPAKPPTLLLAIMRAPFLLMPPTIIWWVQLLGTLLVVYAFWIEPQRLTITNTKITTPKLPGGARIRALHFGDLHMEQMTPRDRRLIEHIKSLEPDLIIFSGDLLSYSFLEDPEAWQRAHEVFKQLTAPLGVFAVRGSPAVDVDQAVEAVLSGLAVRIIEDDKVIIQDNSLTLKLIGVSCSHKPFLDGQKLKALTSGDEGLFTILLYHSPDLAPIASQEPVDLQLSGHTHGGQVRLPLFGALFTASLYGKRFEMGRYTLGRMTLYVTRGLGMEGMAAPRVRFLCPPEIVLWEIQGSD